MQLEACMSSSERLNLMTKHNITGNFLAQPSLLTTMDQLINISHQVETRSDDAVNRR
jgi:hypothetical protein